MAIAARIRPTVRFRCGELVVSTGVKTLMVYRRFDPRPFLLRHLRGEWGNIDQEQWLANERALLDGNALTSAYELSGSRILSITTEADRSMTKVMLLEEG